MTADVELAKALWRDGLKNETTRKILRLVLFKLTPEGTSVYEAGDDFGVVAFRAGRKSIPADLRAQIEAADPFGYVGLLNEELRDAENAKA